MPTPVAHARSLQRPATSARPPGVRMPRAQREDQILRSPRQVFAERGYQATTMEDVAERVGVTKPLIYEYFGSKEGLLSACITQARGPSCARPPRQAWAGRRRGRRAGGRLPRRRAGLLRRSSTSHATPSLLIQQEGAVAPQASTADREHPRAAVRGDRGAPSGLPRASPTSPTRCFEGYAEVVVGACERVAVWRTRRPGVTTEDATELVVSTVWNGLDRLLPRAH